MKLAIATVSLSGDLDEKLSAIADAGFKGVEIFENDLLSFNGTPNEIRALVADLGLEIVTFQPFRDFEGMPPDSRERNFARAERKFDLMAELGCDLLMVCSNVSPESLGGIDRAAADFHALGERARTPRHARRFRSAGVGPSHQRLPRCLGGGAARRPSRVGLVLDTFHILARKTDLTPIRSIPRDRIFLVQFADAPILDMDSLSLSRHFRNFPGQGELPLIDFMMALQATDFDGLLSLEIFNDQFRAGSAQQRRHRRPSLASVPARPDCASAPALPCPDYAVAAARKSVSAPSSSNSPSTKARRLLFEKLLRGLGFVRAGVHKSKSVTRWSQGAHQHRPQYREGRLRAFLQHHPRHRGLRHRPRGR